MRRSLFTVVPATAVAALGVLGLTASVAAASPASPVDKGVPAAASSAAPSSKVPALPSSKAFQNYSQVSSGSLTDAAGVQTAGSVSCPRGTVAIGGGAVISSTSLSENLNGSIPLGDGRTWRVYVNNSGTTDGTFAVFATCVKRNANPTIVVGTAVDNPSGTQNVATAACPSGTVPLGGGGLGSSTATTVNLNSSVPITGGWRVDVNNASDGGDTATAYVVCGVAPNKYKVVAGTATTINAGSQGSASVACPNGTAVLGGGAFSSSGSTLVNLNSTVPSGSTAWVGYENNSSTGTTSLTGYAVCGKTI